MYRLAVVVLNYRTPTLTLNCLSSLAEQLDPAQDKVVIVDNASGDGSATRIRQAIDQKGWGGWTQLIEAEQNKGFSAGNNLGMCSVPANGYWLTNSDTLFHPQAVKTLLQEMENQPNAGILSPRLEWQNGTPQISCFRYHTPISELLDAAKTGLISQPLHHYEVPLPISNTPFTPQWTSFASVLLRGKAVQEVGLMDESFFMYYEDVDYCRRVEKAGWHIWHLPASRVIHLRGQSSPVKEATTKRSKRPHYYYSARAHYFTKYYGKLGFWLANFMWETGRGIALMREIAGNKQPHTCQDEWRDIWTQPFPKGAQP